VRARLEGGPPVPGDVVPDLAALVRRMTSLDPDERPTAAQVAAQLVLRAAGGTPLAVAAHR
jgi:hypothetical protein